MMDKKERIGIKETVRLTARSFQMWHRAYPDMFPSMTIYRLFHALYPYVGIYLSARILDELAGNRDPEQLRFWVILTLVVTTVLLVINALLNHWRDLAGMNFYRKKQQFFAEKMTELDYEMMERSEVHQLQSEVEQTDDRLGWGIGRIVWRFELFVDSIVRSLGGIILAWGLFFVRVPENSPYSWLDHPVTVAMFYLLLFGNIYAVHKIQRKKDSYMNKDRDQKDFDTELYFENAAWEQKRQKDLRFYHQDQVILRGLTKILSKPFVGEKESKGIMGGLAAVASVVSTINMALVYGFICLKSYAGAFGIGSVTQYIGAVTAMSQGVALLIENIDTFITNAPFLKKAFSFFDIPTKMEKGSAAIVSENSGIQDPTDFQIEFRNVSFRYPGSNEYALRNISFTLPVGSRTAIVGMNGSGKSTFIKLLCRLYDPTEGRILLNGVDIREYDYLEYLKLFSVVFQDFRLLALSLGENVAAAEAGTGGYDETRIRQSLDEAGFAERLATLPEGLATSIYKTLDERGIDLSGGEEQKVAIARALYKNAPFLLLDEPTAALDPIVEAEIYSRLDMFSDDRTVIYISHRLSSCRFCDDIVVFHEGEIIQQGTHESLLNDASGKYAELWNAQAQYYVQEGV